ncbi:MAG: hypothetical protein ACREGB_05550, partial [Candidatus Saccharimonadales bacterium]
TNLLTQLTPVPSIPGTYDLQLTDSSGTQPGQLSTFSQLVTLLQGLEQNRLTALVSQLSIQPASGTTDTSSKDKLSFKLTLNVYIKPGTK